MAKWKGSSNRKGQNKIDIQYDSPWNQVQTDALAWNHFISGLGLRMQHWSYMPYIIGAPHTGGLRNYDLQEVPAQSNNPNIIYDNNGIYRYEGDVYVIWHSNSKRIDIMPAGYFPRSEAVVTINRHYIDSEKIVGISEFDKLILVIPPNENPLEYASVNWETVNHNPVGVDKLMFVPVLIERLIDAAGVEYQEGTDFVIEGKSIKWLPKGKRPGIQRHTGKGVPYSVRYRYVPSFYIKYAAHELRNHATLDPATGDYRPVRGPMMAAVQIDFIFLQSIKEQANIEYASQNPEYSRG